MQGMNLGGAGDHYSFDIGLRPVTVFSVHQVDQLLFHATADLEAVHEVTVVARAAAVQENVPATLSTSESSQT